jgi:hypothetical protein
MPPLAKAGGMTSEGEFVTVLRNLFEPDAKALFTFVREMTWEEAIFGF